MTDKELLVLAAKAAEVDISPSWMYGPHWNPLTDDGDALRLAVKLGIDISKAQLAYYDKYSVDPYATTRRSIVLAAADIGKSKEHTT